MKIDAKLLQIRLDHVNKIYKTDCVLETKKENLVGYRIMDKNQNVAFNHGWDVMTAKECLQFLVGLIAAYDFIKKNTQVLE